MSETKREIRFTDLYRHQSDVYDAVDAAKLNGGRVVVVSKRQVGKSLLACLMIIKACIERRGVACIISPTLAQSRKIFRDIVEMTLKTGFIVGANKQTLEIEWKNGSQLLCRSGEQGDHLRGMPVTSLLIFDEASFLRDEVFEIMYPTCDVHRAPILFISTPLFRDGEFYRQYVNPNNVTFNWSDYDLSAFLSPERL